MMQSVTHNALMSYKTLYKTKPVWTAWNY